MSSTALLDFIRPLKRLAKTSKAKLGGVACFFIKNGAIVSSGVNYNPTGEPMEHVVDGTLISQPEVVHAEAAAIHAAIRNGVDLAGTTMLITMSPCIDCAHKIAHAKIRELVYLYDWWDKAGLAILHDAGIHTRQIKEKQ